MKPAGLKITEPRNSTNHRSGLSLSVARGNSYQVWWAPDAFGLIWKTEKMPELIRKENRSEDPAKPRILNRPLSVNSGTLLRPLILNPSEPATDTSLPSPGISYAENCHKERFSLRTLTVVQISKLYETRLILDPGLFELAAELGIEILPEHDGLGVFAAERDPDIDQKALALAARIEDICLRLFGFRAVGKASSYTSNF